MNRIYQGRVSTVQTLVPGSTGLLPEHWEPLDEFPMAAKKMGEEVLFRHHELFQDAVNYYVIALASLGSSPASKLTRLCGLLENVWDQANKKGQQRQGMRDSLMRTWQLAEPPTLADAVERFRQSIQANGVPLTTAEKAGEYLLSKLGGDSAIQKAGPDFFPMFCDVESNPTYKLSAKRRERADDEERLRRALHDDLSEVQIRELAASITLGSVVNLQPDVDPDVGEAAFERLKAARTTFASEVSEELLNEWLVELDDSFSMPKSRGGNINVGRVNSCLLFLAFPNSLTKSLFQSTFSPPKPASVSKKAMEVLDDTAKDESRFLVDGDDPIKKARGTRGFVFQGFTSLPIWKADGSKLVWKGFDIAAFKEALKVFNQFQQNVDKREEKLNSLANRLLVMDGERAMDGYSRESVRDQQVLERLEKIWRECKGKPKLPANDNGEEATVTRFVGDKRIERLRQIVNADLAEEYRLTDGRSTPYGLRRRTMKGWVDVKRKWQSIVKPGVPFSEELREQLKTALDEMRGGEKREKIGSHKLFEALLADEEAWSVWREPDKALADLIVENGWPADPLDAYREYCEIRETIEEVTKRQLNFTPADPRYSRRLFIFTEACSFCNDRGEYKHDPNELAVTVPVAVRGDSGRYSVQRLRLLYSAPRLLRDQIRSDSGAYAQDWSQPMMQALYGEKEGASNPQALKDAAVQLMPDYDSKGERRVLLNFPLTLSTEVCWQRIYELRGQEAVYGLRYSKRDTKKKTPLNGGLWESNIRTFWESDSPKQRDALLWPDERASQDWSKGNWWDKLAGFSVLATDLGTRHAASVALVECSHEKQGTSRFIGHAGGKAWFARYRSGSILRLPGENAMVLRPESPLDYKKGMGTAFREELYGERGRMADEKECNQTLEILEALSQSELMADVTDAAILQKRFSFPEQNDKLLVAVRRAQGWIANCISWHWKLSQPDSEEQRIAAIGQIREHKRVPDWSSLADGTAENLVLLRDLLHNEIIAQRKRVQESLLLLTARILPLRGRGWEWIGHPAKEDCHLLRHTQDGTGPTKVKLRGQRGLSIARIEQLSEVRRRWQSLNQSLRRQIGEKPLTASEMRDDSIPDPCPDILVKLENIREQRVNQTAHLILVQALGLKLREPRLSPKHRSDNDIHGEYQVVRPPVDFIVLEDLSRYLSEQGRSRSENTRLMKWCHRAVLIKVKMLAEPFGIPVLETQAAYSSRFCSLTGIAGFRAAEIGWGDRNDFRWRVLLKEAAEAREKGKPPSENAVFAVALFAQLEEIGKSDQPHRTLIGPQPGGPMFVTAVEVAHPSPSNKRKQAGNIGVLPMQADLNAATNLALRAVAHPSCASVHHRLRTERKKGAKGQADSFIAREPRRFGKDKIGIVIEKENGLPKERNPNLFFDEERVADFGRARLENDSGSNFSYASGPGLWSNVNERMLSRCREINERRLRHWSEDPSDDIQY
ncbi:MAG: type V CRISPR-associated protein Cas12b [Luteolibacter sp.]|jgi:hypothetical protein|nr:type V CRISPR-associated protein Cas12b [Luteolibacter sp.]